MLLILQAIQRLLGRAALATACAACLAGPASASREYPFRFENIKTTKSLELMAHNQGPATMTVYLTIACDNRASDVAWPITRAVPPFSSVSLGRLFLDDPKKSSWCGITRSSHFGDFRAVHSPDVHYRLPYRDGEAHRITQAYGDPLTTHIGHQAQHAVDIAMPEGTAIVATRDGIVVDVMIDYDAGGMYLDLRDKANAVAIQHDDGTIAYYAHLAKRDSPVSVGQRVTAGTVIGYAGNTGYSSGAHLHFAVMKPEVLADGHIEQVALPVKFYVDTWTLPFEPRRGARVTASYSQDSAMRVARAPVGAGESLTHEPPPSVIPVKTYQTTAAGQSAPAVEAQPSLTVTTKPAQESSPAPLQQQAAMQQQPAPQPVQAPSPRAAPSPQSVQPHAISADAHDHSSPGLVETALILFGGLFALVIPAVFWKRARG